MPETEKRRPEGGPRAASTTSEKLPIPSVNALDVYIDNFTRRLLQDALTSATAEAWRNRAELFEAARPRQGDYLGAASADDVAAQDRRLAAQAQACRNHAEVVEFEDLGDLLATVSAEPADSVRVAA